MRVPLGAVGLRFRGSHAMRRSIPYAHKPCNAQISMQRNQTLVGCQMRHEAGTNENAPRRQPWGVEITVGTAPGPLGDADSGILAETPKSATTMLSERASKALGTKRARRTENRYSGLRRPNYAPVVSGIPRKRGRKILRRGPEYRARKGTTGKGASYGR